MAQDGPGTHARWMAILNGVIRSLVTEHNGISIKTLGDGILAEFASAVDAMEWAQNVQRAVGPVEGAADDATPLALRIAIHLGDVVADRGDIYGDGINVAARLQEFADPGGIVLSEAVHDLVRRPSHSERRVILGLVNLRNFERPVHAYATAPEDRALALLARSHQGPIPSIAVLPLQNLGGDPTDVYFSEGVVEDIVVSLAGLRELLVISRNSTLVFGREKADVRDVGRALGVRYVLTGSIRRSSTRVRISVQLCDTTTGASLWADTAEEPLAELFERAGSYRAPHRRGHRSAHPDGRTAASHAQAAGELHGIRLHVAGHRHHRQAGCAAFRTARELLDKAIVEDPEFRDAACLGGTLVWPQYWPRLVVGPRKGHCRCGSARDAGNRPGPRTMRWHWRYTPICGRISRTTMTLPSPISIGRLPRRRIARPHGACRLRP